MASDIEITPSTARRRTRSAHGRPETPAEPRSWASTEAAAADAAAPTRVVNLPGGRRMRLTTDRVRAKPAVSPQLSFVLGQNAIGLGLWGLLAPQSVNSFVGLQTDPQVTRLLFGGRELATGVALASDPTRADALWARVAGDALDIVVLVPLTRRENPKSGNARLALGVVLAVTALDLIAAVRMTGVKRSCA